MAQSTSQSSLALGSISEPSLQGAKMSEQRVVKRKTHTKSRKGCLQCKQRHTKCNEVHPRCANCLRLDIPCTWPVVSDANISSPQQSSPGGTSPFAENPSNGNSDAITSSSGLNLADLRLLHHWTSSAARSLYPNFPQKARVWENELIAYTFDFPFVLRGFLALSAIHKASLLPLNERQSLLMQADSHISRALETYRKHLESPSAEIAIPMFMLSSVLFTYNFASAQVDKPEDPIRGLHHCFMLLQGIKVVVVPYWEMIKESIVFGYMTDRISHESYAVLADTVYEDSTHEILRLEELTELLLDSQDKEACITAIKELHKIWISFRHLSPEREEFSVLFLWPARLTSRFLDLLAAHNPVTCIICTYFAAMMAQARPVWWVKRWPQWLLAASEQLLAVTPDLLQWLNWPKQIIHLQGCSNHTIPKA